MKEYVLSKSLRNYIKISWKYKIICRWIRSIDKVRNKDRFIIYTMYHKYHHDIFKTQKKNVFNIKYFR